MLLNNATIGSMEEKATNVMIKINIDGMSVEFMTAIDNIYFDTRTRVLHISSDIADLSNFNAEIGITDTMEMIEREKRVFAIVDNGKTGFLNREIAVLAFL